jgi:hypothetical protein
MKPKKTDMSDLHPLSCQGEQPPFPEKMKEQFLSQVIHHSHNLPRCGKCGAIVVVPAGTCQPCTNCGELLNPTCG